MATIGPNAQPLDTSTKVNFLAWAGDAATNSGTGIGLASALYSLGWRRTADDAQVDWTNITALPVASSAAPVATAYPQYPWKTNVVGEWSSSTYYKYGDVVKSSVGSGGNGNSYVFLMTNSTTTSGSSQIQSGLLVTNISLTTNVVTVTVANINAPKLAVNDTVQLSGLYNATFLNGQSLTVASVVGAVTSFTANFVHANYASTAEPSGVVSFKSATRPESDSTHWAPYFYEIWQSQDTQIATITNVAVTSNVATLTCNSVPLNWRAGMKIVVGGLTNTSLNDTWAVVTNVDTTHVTLRVPGVSNIASVGDSGTATYTMTPICMKFEYFANSITSTCTEPVYRVSYCLGGTDGVGNLMGTAIDNYTALGASTLQPPEEMRPVSGLAANVIFAPITNIALTSNVVTITAANGFSSTQKVLISGVTTSTFLNGQTLTIATVSATQFTANFTHADVATHADTGKASRLFSTVYSGSNAMFGTFQFYKDNAGTSSNGRGIIMGIERGKMSNGTDTDSYATWVGGVSGNGVGLFALSGPAGQRTFMQPNPWGTITKVSLTSNAVTVTYTQGWGYTFCKGQIVNLQGLVGATFLNNQYLTITSVAAGTFTASFTHADYASQPDRGTASLTVSTTNPTAMPGTGGLGQRDANIASIFCKSLSLALNGNAPLLPIFHTPGICGPALTILASLRVNDCPAEDTTQGSITINGATHTYRFSRGAGVGNHPFIDFGAASANCAAALRWD